MNVQRLRANSLCLQTVIPCNNASGRSSGVIENDLRAVEGLNATTLCYCQSFYCTCVPVTSPLVHVTVTGPIWVYPDVNLGMIRHILE